LENQAKILEGCKQILMGDSCGNSEGQNTNRNTDCEGFAHEVLNGNEDSWELG
jgi:hypothetical protein